MTHSGHPPRFIADCHLGKVAKYLRVMGFDTLYFPQIDDDELIVLANAQARTILTRDKELCARNKASCFLVHPTQFSEQMHVLAEAFELHRHLAPFSRCIVCNTPLQKVEKASVMERLPPKVAKYFDAFERCPQCDRLYWHGDHYKKMKAFIATLL